MDALSYSEVWSILNQIEPRYVQKIPIKILEKINSNKIPNYDTHIDLNLPLENQLIGSYSKLLICYLNIEYLSTKEERETLEKIYTLKETNYLNENINQNLLPILRPKSNIFILLFSKFKNFVCKH